MYLELHETEAPIASFVPSSAEIDTISDFVYASTDGIDYRR